MESLKENLRNAVEVHKQNAAAGDFSCGSLLSHIDLPNAPSISINNYGILPLPINDAVYKSIASIFEDSPFGLGEETVFDKSVRNSIQLDPSKFAITNQEFCHKVSVLVNTKIKETIGLCDSEIYALPYKLLVNKTVGKFQAHRDTEKEHNMFGTLIVQLPSIFTGGDLVITHNQRRRIFKNSEDASTQCKFVAHYASCLHELKEITSGSRTALVYSLCWNGNGIQPSADATSGNFIKLHSLLNRYLDIPEIQFFYYFLDFEYSDKSIESGIINSLKGSDKYVVKGLLNSINYDSEQSGRRRLDAYIATANHRLHKYGDCHSSGRRWGDGCSGNAYGHERYGVKQDEYFSVTLFPFLVRLVKSDLEWRSRWGKNIAMMLY